MSELLKGGQTVTSDLCARSRLWRRRTLAALLVAAVLGLVSTPVLAVPSGGPSSGTPPFEQQVLFKASLEQGYACFRIPAVVRSNNGTLLAFAEGRVHNCGDAGDIDVVLRRSFDGGRTWSPLQVINKGGGDTHGNPAPLVDTRTGRIVLATTYNKGRSDSLSCEVPCDRTPHLQFSDDDGRTWSRPQNLTRELRRADWNSWYATGPVHGIQLTRGRHAGRLVFGVNAESHNGTRITANHAALVHSDDGGQTWQIGAVDSWPTSADDGTFRQKPSELTLVELNNGEIYTSGREQDGTDLGHRTFAVSRDGGSSFAGRFRAIPDLYTPMVQGSVTRLHPASADGCGRLLFAAPSDPDRRRTMMVRSSYDEGRTWDSADRGRVVTNDWSGYSDMTVISHDAIGLVYEGGVADARDEIRFARFTEQWLGPRRGPDPTTPDFAPGANGAAVLGAPRPTVGRFGPGLDFDGIDDAVRLPFRHSLPLGTRNFTTSLWFRYTAKTGEQPFLWMGSVGTTSPQVALRGDPARDRITAQITTRAGASTSKSVSVNTVGAYNDGRWHHLALRRTGGRVILSVDGISTSAPDVRGTVSRTSPFGVHLGQRMDSRAFYRGALDEVRTFDRALSDFELYLLRSFNLPSRHHIVSWIPLDQVRPVGPAD